MGYFNRKRANSVVIPDEPLNNIKICSGVAAAILSGQFDDDISWYKTHFNAFLVAYYKKDLLSLDKEILRKIDEYAVNTNNEKHSPNSIATLVRAEELKGELGAIVQNAIIYAIAMSIASEAKTQEMKDTIAGTSMMRGASNTQTPEEYRAFMLSAHPRASAIAETLAHLESKWRNDKLLTNAAYKPDDSARQHDKLLEAFANVYDRQDMPRISKADIFGDNTAYEPPFWETVLAPQLIDNQYEIRQMDYDLNNSEQPFVDIKITDLKLHRSIELAAKSSEPISDDEPKELEHRGLRITRDSLVDYNGTGIQLTGQETAALRVLMVRPDELRLREDISTELSEKNARPDNLAKLISSLRIKLSKVIGYNCIENKSGQGWALRIHPLE